MKRKIKRLAIMFMLITPVLTFPKFPSIPNISGSVKLPVGVEEAAKKAGTEAASKIKFNFKK